MSKNTAVEWLVTELRNRIAEGTLDAIAISTLKMKAKAMEREQIINAYATAVSKENNTDYIGMHEETSGEIYYNETYKGGEQ